MQVLGFSQLALDTFFRSVTVTQEQSFCLENVGGGSLSPGEACRKTYRILGQERGLLTGLSANGILHLKTKNVCIMYCFTTSVSYATHEYHKPTFEIVNAHKTHIPIHPTTKNISLLTFQINWKLSSNISTA
jgi:hypothetical protein